MNFKQKLRNAKSFGEIFDVVKKVVFHYCRKDQAGLMLGLGELGGSNNKFIGAFYSLNGNMIVINKQPLIRIIQTNPQLYNSYVFHILLHEYIHSLGIMDENICRELTYDINYKYFGPNDQVTDLASDIGKFMPNLVYPENSFSIKGGINIEFVPCFDRTNTNYIM